MYSNKNEVRDKTTEVVDFDVSNNTFSYLGIDFQIFNDNVKGGVKRPPLALKVKETGQRLSGLFSEGSNIAKGDIRNGFEKRFFTFELSPDKTKICLTGFREALSLIGITNQDTKTEGLKRLTEASTRDRKGYVDNPALKTAIEHI